MVALQVLFQGFQRLNAERYESLFVALTDYPDGASSQSIFSMRGPANFCDPAIRRPEEVDERAVTRIVGAADSLCMSSIESHRAACELRVVLNEPRRRFLHYAATVA